MPSPAGKGRRRRLTNLLEKIVNVVVAAGTRSEGIVVVAIEKVVNVIIVAGARSRDIVVVAIEKLSLIHI